MKQTLQTVLSLTIIAAVCAGVLATVNAVTREQIATIRTRAVQNAARLVMPPSVRDIETRQAPDGDWFVGKAADGRAIAYALKGVSHQGYGGDIVLMVGFLNDRTLVTYQKLEAAETPGLGSNLTNPAFMKQFHARSAAQDLAVKKDGGEIEAITSATITSRAVCGAINAARHRLDNLLAR